MNAIAVDFERDESSWVGVVELGHGGSSDADFVMKLGDRDAVTGKHVRKEGFNAAVGSEIAKDSGVQQAAQHADAPAAFAGVLGDRGLEGVDGDDAVGEPLLHAASNEGRGRDGSEVDEGSGGPGDGNAVLQTYVPWPQVRSAVRDDAGTVDVTRGGPADLDDERWNPCSPQSPTAERCDAAAPGPRMSVAARSRPSVLRSQR